MNTRIEDCECCSKTREVNAPGYCEECWEALSLEDRRYIREEYEDDYAAYLRR